MQQNTIPAISEQHLNANPETFLHYQMVQSKRQSFLALHWSVRG